MKRLPTLLSFLPLTFAAAMVLPAHAERADRDQPMHIESDALRHDELQQTSVFTGNVVMTKGSIVLRGAQLDVRQKTRRATNMVWSPPPRANAPFFAKSAIPPPVRQRSLSRARPKSLNTMAAKTMCA